MIALLILLYGCGCIATTAFIDSADSDAPPPTPRWLRLVLTVAWPVFWLGMLASLAFVDPGAGSGGGAA